MNVSERSVYSAMELLATGRDDLVQAVQAGTMSMNAALKAAKPETYGPRKRSALEQLKASWKVASEVERTEFLGWLSAQQT
jgi:hypothetical protein